MLGRTASPCKSELWTEFALNYMFTLQSKTLPERSYCVFSFLQVIPFLRMLNANFVPKGHNEVIRVGDLGFVFPSALAKFSIPFLF